MKESQLPLSFSGSIMIIMMIIRIRIWRIWRSCNNSDSETKDTLEGRELYAFLHKRSRLTMREESELWVILWQENKERYAKHVDESQSFIQLLLYHLKKKKETCWLFLSSVLRDCFVLLRREGSCCSVSSRDECLSLFASSSSRCLPK